MSLVKWVHPSLIRDCKLARDVAVIPLKDLTEVVEGLNLIRDIARHDHTGPLNPFGWLVRIDEEAQHLLTQLEAVTK